MNRSAPVLVAALLGLAACAGPEAGGSLDDGRFGFATLNNAGLHTGAISAVQNLSRRFAAEVPSTVTFAFNSSALDADAREALRRQADWIRQFPEVRFRVYGHTDLVGTEAYNVRLGQRRAEAVVAFLAAQGIGRDRLEALSSFGETQPVVPTTAPERRNRRAVTDVSGFVTGSSPLLNGKYAAIVFRTYVDSAETGHPAITGGNSTLGQVGQ
ncbi:MAG: OmpA family protein [Rhodobacteraceae bacterium]|nr:OmpA family protein [Paracoccaceae bacterium]